MTIIKDKPIYPSIINYIHQQGKEITIDGKLTKEATGIKYIYDLSKTIFQVATDQSTGELITAPVEEEKIERDFIILRSIDQVKEFHKEIHTRRACFVNNYDGLDNHCLSYFQYTVRDNKLSMFVYVRSQNVMTNFDYDNQTFNLAYYVLYNNLLGFYPNLEIGKIEVQNFSLHIYL